MDQVLLKTILSYKGLNDIFFQMESFMPLVPFSNWNQSKMKVIGGGLYQSNLILDIFDIDFQPPVFIIISYEISRGPEYFYQYSFSI